jgi:hypothetical protein
MEVLGRLLCEERYPHHFGGDVICAIMSGFGVLTLELVWQSRIGLMEVMSINILMRCRYWSSSCRCLERCGSFLASV